MMHPKAIQCMAQTKQEALDVVHAADATFSVDNKLDAKHNALCVEETNGSK